MGLIAAQRKVRYTPALHLGHPMHFVDECQFRVLAGHGGDGAVAFRREKFVPFGGPAGGDGGRGGSVLLRADPGLGTLYDFRRRATYQAPKGGNGQARDRYGAAGKDLILAVPLGTQVIDVAAGTLLGELTEHNAQLVVAQGGRGGRGNIHFATPTDRAPRKAEPGEQGEAREIRLELKVMADVGLLGFPNVGKSTFVRAVSRATPKVADYPFTTLVPHLGVVAPDFGGSPFVVADIPGLIAGASDGVGLGHRFLKHVERTRVLLHLITLSDDPGREPVADYRALRRELGAFSPELAERREIVALSQADRPEVQEAYPALREQFERDFNRQLWMVSGVSRKGLPELLTRLEQLLH